jgi:hypothetical protein
MKKALIACVSSILLMSCGRADAGMGWNEFLGGETDVSVTGEERLRNYIARRGRKSIRERWLRVWEQHKDTIFWDTEERCFVSKNAN